MARSHFGFENHYIPAKHSSEVHTWSWLLYTGWIPHVHMLALITTQQLGMQVHKASLAGRKLFLEEFARPWVCCTAEPPARHVSATWGKNPLLMQCSCQIIAVWACGKTCSQIQLSLMTVYVPNTGCHSQLTGGCWPNILCQPQFQQNERAILVQEAWK